MRNKRSLFVGIRGLMYKTTVRANDPVFGQIERSFENENPYDLFWAVMSDTELRGYIDGKKQLSVIHVDTNQSMRVTVDFDGTDEHGFSMPLVANEDKFDIWLAQFGWTPSWQTS